MSMRSQVLVEHHGVATGKEMTTWQTLRRGVELSPELRKGIWVTVLLAVLSTLGRVLVPFVVQRITDDGLLAEGGPDTQVVAVYIGVALVGVAVTAVSAYFVNIRLFRSSENGLATLRLRAFRHIHDLAMLTQNT